MRNESTPAVGPQSVPCKPATRTEFAVGKVEFERKAAFQCDRMYLDAGKARRSESSLDVCRALEIALVRRNLGYRFLKALL